MGAFRQEDTLKGIKESFAKKEKDYHVATVILDFFFFQIMSGDIKAFLSFNWVTPPLGICPQETNVHDSGLSPKDKALTTVSLPGRGLREGMQNKLKYPLVCLLRLTKPDGTEYQLC